MKTAWRTQRVAVIGAGDFGSLHARTLSGMAEADLVAIVDSDRERAIHLAAELSVPCTTADLEEALDQKLDAVIIASRTDSHVPLALLALAAGCHVLVEKPVGRSVAEVGQLQAAAKTADLIAMAGHICLFHPLVDGLLARVKQEGFEAAHFVRHRSAAICERFPEECPVRLSMIHDLAVLAQMVCNREPDHLEAIAASRPDGVRRYSWATFRWVGGEVATLHSHWCLPGGEPGGGWDNLEVFGKNYHSRIETSPQAFTWTTDRPVHPFDLQIFHTAGRPGGMLVGELQAFLAACQGGEIPPGCRLTDAEQIQRWTDQLLDSVQPRMA